MSADLGLPCCIETPCFVVEGFLGDGRVTEPNLRLSWETSGIAVNRHTQSLRLAIGSALFESMGRAEVYLDGWAGWSTEIV